MVFCFMSFFFFNGVCWFFFNASNALCVILRDILAALCYICGCDCCNHVILLLLLKYFLVYHNLGDKLY